MYIYACMYVCILTWIIKHNVAVGAPLPGKGVTQGRHPLSHKVVSALV